MLELKRAQRSKAYLKLGISAPSGGGKTLGALLTAYGLMKGAYPDATDEERWSKIAIIDTEHGSGELYVGVEVAHTKVGVYNAITLEPEFTVEKFIDAINLCKDSGMEVCIIDSSTHLWSGEGGLLDQHQNIAKRIGNSFMAWRDITPLHNDFVELMLQVPMHIIATMRSKQEYLVDKEGNSTLIRKVGLEPEQRKGMEYEFTIFLEINTEHQAFCSKDRTSLFDQKTFIITPTFGEELMKWLQGATSEQPRIIAQTHESKPERSIESLKSQIIQKIKALGGSQNETLMALIKEYAPSGNTNTIKDPIELGKLFGELEDFEEQQKERIPVSGE